MKTYFDHLVVGATTLNQGVRYVRERLGVEISYGGQHPQMGTHNCLGRLSESSFLEVIAIDPQGRKPERPRWFGLDDRHIRANLEKAPRLITWVVNSSNIDTALTAAQINSGIAQQVSRGDLYWSFGIPDDGRLFYGGMLPYIISWENKGSAHPAASMADIGCNLSELRLYTPFPEWTENHLQSIGAGSAITVIPIDSKRCAYLEAELNTPNGVRLLSSDE